MKPQEDHSQLIFHPSRRVKSREVRPFCLFSTNEKERNQGRDPADGRWTALRKGGTLWGSGKDGGDLLFEVLICLFSSDTVEWFRMRIRDRMHAILKNQWKTITTRDRIHAIIKN